MTSSSGLLIENKRLTNLAQRSKISSATNAERAFSGSHSKLQ